MLKIKQKINSEWLSGHLMDTGKGNMFPAMTIIEVREFDEDAAGEFDSGIWEAVNNGQMIIPIVVDSYGGAVYSLMRMLDTITAAKTSGATIITIGKGKMMSCGSVLVAAGTKGYRYTQPQSSMMVHEVSSGGRGKCVELLNDVAETNRLNDILLHKLAEFAGKQKKYFIDLIHQVGHADIFLSAKDTVQLGLIDFIGEPAINMNINMTVEVTLLKK